MKPNPRKTEVISFHYTKKKNDKLNNVHFACKQKKKPKIRRGHPGQNSHVQRTPRITNTVIKSI